MSSSIPSSTFSHWLRLNLGVTVTVISLVSGGIGALVSGTLHVARGEQRIDAIEHSLADATLQLQRIEKEREERDERRIKLAADLGVINQRLAGLEQTAKQLPPLQTQVIDLDSRGASNLAQMRRDLDAQIAALGQRTAVLEAQIRWVGDRIQTAPQTGARR